jgi:hypothetical protein
VLLIRYVCEGLSEQQVLDIQATDPVRNVSITRLLRRSDRQWELLAYNDVGHVQRSGAPVTEHRGPVDVENRV